MAHGFLLHDIGKIGIPDVVLHKPGKLDPDERALMEKHPELGERIVAGIPYLDGRAREVMAAPRRWDDSGYPWDSKGLEIRSPHGSSRSPTRSTR